ncbi:MAG: alanine racemase [Candidatus Eiseniibacteriota bacterium]
MAKRPAGRARPTPRRGTRRGAPAAPAFGSTGTVLTVDLRAIAANYRALKARARPAQCAAVVKADAYGVGMVEVAPALAAAGCTDFFVAHLDEGIALRKLLPKATIYVLNGALAGAEPELRRHKLRPVLNHLAALDRWARLGRKSRPLPAALHVDSGMSRLGLDDAELATLMDTPKRLDGVELALVMSHLACSEQPDHPLNAEQRARFGAALARLPKAPASLANSSGVFLGPDFRFDMVRPGAALYGVNPVPGQPNPMKPVVRLQARILQVRRIDSPRTVGYGATHRAARPSTIATIALGYADGYLRSLGNRGSCLIGEHRVPVVGRISMDLVTLDVTDVPGGLAAAGAVVDVISPAHPVDAVAEEAGTIGYEILTSLGRRYQRRYLGASA